VEPTLAGFMTFIRQVMGITTQQLPDDAYSIPLAFNAALTVVNVALVSVDNPNPALPNLYAMAVYNLAADRLLNWALDSDAAPVYKNGEKFFAYTREKLDIFGFTPGVIQSTNDLTTGGSFVVPEFFKELTMRDLSNLKTPYGREYLAIAQDYGPSEWGVS
jgi:hypothetical protein